VSRPDYLKNKKVLWEGAQSLHSPEGTPIAVSGQSVDILEPTQLQMSKEKIRPVTAT
jgi:hypothetical protein